MRSKYSISKFPTLAVTLTIVGLVLAVLATSFSIWAYNQKSYDSAHLGALAIIEIVAAVLFLAGLTTFNGTLVKIISIILTAGIVVTSFVLSMVKLSQQDAVFFPISLMMLIASVLELIYFLSLRYNDRISKLYLVSSIVFCAFALAYGITYISIDLVDHFYYGYRSFYIDNYFLLLALVAIAALPAVSFFSLTKEEKEQPQE